MTRRDKALTHAIAFLRQRGKYVLDHGTPAPKWGNHTDKPDMFDRIFFTDFPEFADEVENRIDITLLIGG